jgi:adenine-specific DNA-methyltransferase
MTELIWDGKYKDGKKTAPVRISLPFQTIETVNESTEDRKRNLDLFASRQETEWRNRLIWGDKKFVLPSLLDEFAGKVNLIYIDPPFDTGADFSFTANIPDNPETDEDETTSFTKEPSIIEQKAYRDTWGKGLDSYLQWFYETIVLLRELLAENGSIYVHLDWHVGHYAKTVLDEIFGYGNFLDNIVWCYKTRQFSKKYWNRKHDDIFLYTKSANWVFNWEKVMSPLSESTIKKYRLKDEKGNRYRLNGRGITGSPIRSAKDVDAKWEITHPELVVRDYLREGYPPEDWWVMDIVNQVANERTDYSTQKPEALLEKIIKASSNENDLVLDCFCGSGTTVAVAEKLNRRWITCDLGRFAIHTTRKRLLQIPNVKPFIVQNLGKYERQAWATEEFADPKDRANMERTYRDFIVELYNGKPINNYIWLHGIKANRMIHVGNVDSPVSLGDVKSIIQEFWKSVGKKENASPKSNGIDVLGWEFAFDLNETALQQAAANKVNIKFKKIPREVLEKKAVEQGDIKFFELAALEVKAKIAGKIAELSLKDFVVPPDDIPEDVQKAITHWSQWIDYWAIDWNYKDDTFHNQWQSYRTKKDMKLELTAKHEYDEKGKYTVIVKVIDILGNDTTKAIEVNIK